MDQTERPFGKNEKKPIQPKTNEQVLHRLVRVTNVRNGRFVRFRRVHVGEKNPTGTYFDNVQKVSRTSTFVRLLLEVFKFIAKKGTKGGLTINV